MKNLITFFTLTINCAFSSDNFLTDEQRLSLFVSKSQSFQNNFTPPLQTYLVVQSNNPEKNKEIKEVLPENWENLPQYKDCIRVIEWDHQYELKQNMKKFEEQLFKIKLLESIKPIKGELIRIAEPIKYELIRIKPLEKKENGINYNKLYKLLFSKDNRGDKGEKETQNNNQKIKNSRAMNTQNHFHPNKY